MWALISAASGAGCRNGSSSEISGEGGTLGAGARLVTAQMAFWRQCRMTSSEQTLCVCAGKRERRRCLGVGVGESEG